MAHLTRLSSYCPLILLPNLLLYGSWGAFSVKSPELTSPESWHVQAPDAMRSLASALQLLTTALGSYVATAVTTIINSVRVLLTLLDTTNVGAQQVPRHLGCLPTGGSYLSLVEQRHLRSLSLSVKCSLQGHGLHLGQHPNASLRSLSSYSQ